MVAAVGHTKGATDTHKVQTQIAYSGVIFDMETPEEDRTKGFSISSLYINSTYKDASLLVNAKQVPILQAANPENQPNTQRFGKWFIFQATSGF